MIAIINYGVGNLTSIKNMFKKIGIEAIISSDEQEILSADKLILPGIGAFDHCMQKFNSSGLRPTVTKKVFENKTPVIGICVGLQMLTEKSEEGSEPGLGWIKGRTIRFQQSKLGSLKIPHMSWTTVTQKKTSCLTEEFQQDARFYFVHSFHVEVVNPEDELLSAHYGYDFTVAISRDNIYGVQFHPEKSHKFGMQLFKNFALNC